MKYFIYIFLVLFAFKTQAQLGGRGMRNQLPQTQSTPKAPEFEIERYVGIVYYDVEKAAKKTGIDLSSKEGKKFATSLKIYNRDTDQIKIINGFTLKSTKDMVENFQNNALKTGDLSNQQKVQKTMAEKLKPILEAIKVEDKKLDDKIVTLLSEKQYKKWVKFNKKNYKHIPERKE